MSERSLVVHQDSLAAKEEAMTTASGRIADHITGLLDTVNATTGKWTHETGSRVAQQDYERRLREGLTQLTEALDSVRAAVAHHREAAREIEVENVAIVG